MDRLLALPFSALCLGALWLALLLVLLFAWLLSRRPVRVLDEIIAGRGWLHRGPCAIGGEVELAPDEPIALDVKITQQGTRREAFYSPPGDVRNIQKLSYVHWETLSEEIVARPFIVRRANGERIRVEPPADAKFRGLMDVRVEEAGLRSRFGASLRPGDKVFIEGSLSRVDPPPEPGPEKKGGGAYRAAAPREVVSSTWVLGSREGQPMRIMRQPFRRPIPGAEERRRMRARGIGLWAVLAMGALAQLVLQLPLLEWVYGLVAIGAGALMLLTVGAVFENPTRPEPEDGLAAAETKTLAEDPFQALLPLLGGPSAAAVPGRSDPNAGLGTGVNENGEPFGMIG
jgi:hypothetical protein